MVLKLQGFHLYIFFGNISIQMFWPLYNKTTCFLLLNYKGSMYILNTSLFSDIWFANIFFSLGVLLLFIYLCVCVLFLLIDAVFWNQKFLIWWIWKYLFLFLLLVLLVSYLRDYYLIQIHKDLLLYSKSFIVLIIAFMSWLHFELIFVYGRGSTSFFFNCRYPVSQHCLLKKLSYLLMSIVSISICLLLIYKM